MGYGEKDNTADFDSVIRWFESSYPSSGSIVKRLRHAPFTGVTVGSIPP